MTHPPCKRDKSTAPYLENQTFKVAAEDRSATNGK